MERRSEEEMTALPSEVRAHARTKSRLAGEIENFRFENRYQTRSAATQELIRRGLETVKKEKEQPKQPKEQP